MFVPLWIVLEEVLGHDSSISLCICFTSHFSKYKGSPHPSHYGYLCPVETPEGPACGLIKAFALGARVTLLPSSKKLKEYRLSIISLLLPVSTAASQFVLFNGEIIGHTEDPNKTVDQVRLLEPPGEQPYCSPSVYVSPCESTVCIHTEEGRIVRPLFCATKCADMSPGATDVQVLLDQRVLRYVDAAEIATLDVALDTTILGERRKHGRTVDLLEIHAHLILGVTAGLIPLLQANQSPRNAYQTSMGRQGRAFLKGRPSFKERPVAGPRCHPATRSI